LEINTTKLKIELPYVPAVPLLGIYLKEWKSTHNRDTYTPMFILILSTIAKLWNQVKGPSTDEWIKTMWYTSTMRYYSTIKKNEIMSFEGK
jgi:CRISPR/Cas system endoribonuclease Cas6 (RAMP superfamily)